MPLKEQQTIDIFQRLATLETELKNVREEVTVLEAKMSYYDKVALKWGGALMGVVVCGAFLGGHFEKLANKAIEWYLR